MDLIEIEQDFYCGFNAGWLNIISFVKETNTTNESVLMRKQDLGLKYKSIKISDNSLADARNLYKSIKSLYDSDGVEDVFITGNKLYDMKIDRNSAMKDQYELNSYFYEVMKPMVKFIAGVDEKTNDDHLCTGIHVTLSSGVPFAIAVACIALGLNVKIYVAKGLILDNIFGDYVEYDREELICIINDSVDRLVNDNYFLIEDPLVC